MSFGTWVDQRIANVLTILGVEKRLDQIQQDAKQELDELRAAAITEFEQTRDQALGMVKQTMDGVVDSLPKMAAAVSEAAVTTVFDHTQIDETTDRVTGVFTNILDALPFGIGRPPQ